MDDLETLTCRMPTQTHRLLTRLQAETTPKEMGAKSWNEVLRIRWRLSTAEASRRLHEAADLAARTSLTGQPLAPLLPAVAAAQAAGLITGEHVAAIRDAIKRLPSWVDTTHRRAVRGGPGARRGRRRAQRAARDRRPAAVPARSGRPRTRRRRTRPQTPLHHHRPGPRRDDRGQRELHPRSVGGVGGDLRQIRRTRACATPPTTSPAPRAPRPKPRSTTTTAAWPNANTTRCWRSGASR